VNGRPETRVDAAMAAIQSQARWPELMALQRTFLLQPAQRQ
jgi:hypothetical protein